MKKLPILITVIIALIIGFAGGWFGGSRSSPPINDTIVFRDTITDTITYRQPIPVDSVILRYIPVKLPIIDTTYIKGLKSQRWIVYMSKSQFSKRNIRAALITLGSVASM